MSDIENRVWVAVDGYAFRVRFGKHRGSNQSTWMVEFTPSPAGIWTVSDAPFASALEAVKRIEGYLSFEEYLEGRPAPPATERETALAKRVEELTKERDEVRAEASQLRSSIGDVEAQLKSNLQRSRELVEAEFAPMFEAVRRVDEMKFELTESNARLDELRRVIAELVRK